MEGFEIIEVSPRRTLLISIIVLWLGIYLTKKAKWLKSYNIPAAVTGGLICSVLVAFVAILYGYQITFNLWMRDILLLIFFSTIGLTANIKLLVNGGKCLFILLIAASVFLVVQNLVGLFVASLFEGHFAYGLLTGSVSFAGGHGTAITYGKLFTEQYQLPATEEIAIACATLGLIVGGLVGGPLAEKLINKNKLSPSNSNEQSKSLDVKNNNSGKLTSMNAIINATFLIVLCIGCGEFIHLWLKNNDIVMPLYLPGLFVGILITNIGDLLKIKKTSQFSNAISLWSDVSLTLFLAMSLMSMQLLVLSQALRPLMLVLVFQVIVMSLFSYIIVFRIMGRDYDAAVISSGFAGLGLGATPVGMANMRAVSEKYGNSAKAFLVIPLLGAFFIDVVNALILQGFMSLPFLK
ncbi:sodium/glutamate symporter [Spartinivicinus poritis]|uniref:Sodium/glutamate symporter n=1 Tax=Spartinivicinus poritis TaxID=2994640 RepID=A0ABT5UDF2_9GAMM|nr:sodium/glutamate symporter [Spartinivicinus sp. A2-2]MDE1464404.1 sodium/glutamate symporter [Spartinivicinus sp. A2-2]